MEFLSGMNAEGCEPTVRESREKAPRGIAVLAERATQCPLKG